MPAPPKTRRRFLNAKGKEVRLGSVQRHNLELCAINPQRRAAGNPTMRALSGHGFVTGDRHFSERLGRHTTDYVHAITPEGRRYLREGRDR